MDYPSDFTEDMRKQGICGVLAIAVASKRTLADAHEACKRHLMPHQKRHVRRTYDEQIIASIEGFGRRVEELPVVRQNLRKWVDTCSQPNETYVVFVSGHVLTVKNDMVLDQAALDHYNDHPSKRQFVQRVLRIS